MSRGGVGARLLVWASACLFFLAAASRAEADAGSTLVLVRSGYSAVLDPARAVDAESILVDAQMFEGLVRMRDGTARIEPCLAESWSVSSDGLDWTFRLRRGVLFHDGAQLDSRAVAASFRRLIASAGNAGRFPSSLAHVARVEAVDARTVRFRLSRPVAALLTVLAAPYAAVVRRAAGSWPTGTGPFRLFGSRPGELVLARNSAYWGDRARVARLVLRSVPDSAERFRLIQTGRADVITDIRPSDLPLLAKSPGVRLLQAPGMNVAYLAMNTRRGFFRSLTARRAVQLALNREGIVRLAYGDSAEPVSALVPPELLGRVRGKAGPPSRLRWDPAAARRLLARNGGPPARPLTLLVMGSPRPYMPEPLRVARAVRESLAAVGLRVRVLRAPWEGYLARAAEGAYDLCLLGWVADTSDPHEMLRALLGWDDLRRGRGANVSFWRNARYRSLVELAETTRNAAARAELYARALDLARSEAPLVPFARVREFAAVRANVFGVVVQPFGALLRFDKAVKQ